MFASLPFQSTRPVRGATRNGPFHTYLVRISIHAPRAGRDVDGLIFDNWREISIHAPRAGRDPPGRERTA